ncbi:M56 family metallopeptidase [Dyadobacter subterraneus]|uniref:M56 family metallopeptidase n=1 Tax=Dyadobacter subterraneus TaxID=2773304 RepID=A0ABR9W9L3_9BACT|nr:M56 family metallopeptidase [Dyadobacter subterraneus]MBE9462173.1 M56 family metallopeptidase [Dyadobacter subterraneus]
MNEFLYKASIITAVAFLFYKIFLQRESFFTANRIYLIGCLVLTFTLPFLSLPALINHQGYLATVLPQNSSTEENSARVNARQLAAERSVQHTSANPSVAASKLIYQDPALPQEASQQPIATTEYSFGFWLFTLYLFGVAVFSGSLLVQLGNILYRIRQSADKIQDGTIVIVNATQPQAPCSFFNFVFIYPDVYDFETYEHIISHEKIHARLYHSLDLLLAEIAAILLWFNPFIWLLKKEIEKNNEYQTDAFMVEKVQVNKQQYQLNLLQIAVPNRPLSITTNYNQSVLKQRIMMMNAKRSTPHAYWKYSFLVPVFFGTLLLLNKPASSREMSGNNIQNNPLPVESADPLQKANPQSEKQPNARDESSIGNYTDSKTDMSSGYWYSHQDKENYCLEFKGSQGNSQWNMSRCFRKDSFKKTGDNSFVLTKDAGTMQLNGNLLAEVSQGKYTFTENKDFANYLAANSTPSQEKNLVLFLFFADVNRQYLEFLKSHYQTLDGQRLLEIAIHDIGLTEFQGYIALFEQYNHKKPSMSEIIEAKIHGVDQQYVQQMEKMGFSGLSMKKIIEAKIHGIEPGYVQHLKDAGLANLSLDKVIEAKIHDVNPNSVKELKALGFADLNLTKMIELNIHGVTPTYIQELQSAGLKNITLQQALEAKIHGLDAGSIKELRALGFTNVSFDEIRNARIHGVDASFVKGLKEAGLPGLTIEKAIEAKIHAIDGTFIQAAKKKGYDFTSIDKYISLKIHNQAIESLKE